MQLSYLKISNFSETKTSKITQFSVYNSSPNNAKSYSNAPQRKKVPSTKFLHTLQSERCAIGTNDPVQGNKK